MAQDSGWSEASGAGMVRRADVDVRLNAFVDAAFAFAVTLLVISIDSIPETVDDLLLALRGVPAFGLSFAMIAMFWSAHARWGRRYRLRDGWSTVLSLALVFLVLVYVYPLKMMFASFMAAVSGGFLSPEAFNLTPDAIPDVLRMFVIYGVIFATLSLCLVGLHLRVWWLRTALGLDAERCGQAGGDLFAQSWFVVVGLISVLAALLVPAELPRAWVWLVGAPWMLYALLSLTGVADSLGRRWAERHVQGRMGA